MNRARSDRRWLGLAVVCTLGLLPGCPSDPVMPGADTGTDAAGGSDGGGRDSGPTDGGGRDTGAVDGGRDAGGSDAGADGGSDAGSDTGSDAGSDAGSCVAADCDDMNPCNGVEVCQADNSCGPGTAPADGTTCDIDADPTTRDLCVAGLCGPSRCGDGFVDTGEDCDDANDVNGDGCDACVFSCTMAATCDDGNACTGTETCGTDHVCAAGTPPADGASCGGVNVCMGGICVPPACTMASDCDDGLRCDGVEACTTMMCVVGTAVDCADTDACTADSCSETGTMCVHTLIDADGDGFAPTTLGACGTDCNDMDATVSPAAVDACGDGIDNDCNGAIDDAGMTLYYADCDGDDYAAMGTVGVMSCLPPAPSMTGCTTGGAWTTRVPTTAADSDCNDANPAVNPGQTVYQTTAIAGEPVASDFDYDCSMTEVRQVTTRGSCRRVGLASCLYTAGWAISPGTAIPECGVDASYVDSCTASTCMPVTSTHTQACL